MGFGTPAFHAANWTASSAVSQLLPQLHWKAGYLALAPPGLKTRPSIPLVDPGMPAFRLPQAERGLFPVRVCRHHPAPVPGRCSCPASSSRCGSIFVPLVDVVRLQRERFPPVGRRLLGAAGRRGLLRRLCDPPGRRSERICRCGYGRSSLEGDREKALPHNLPLVAIGAGSSGWVGTGSTEVTLTSPVPTPPRPSSTPTWPRRRHCSRGCSGICTWGRPRSPLSSAP